MKHLFYVLPIFFLMACSSGGNGKLDDARLPLPNESANSKMFGTWTFKVKPEGTDCKNVDLSKLGETFYEEGTIFKTKEGCRFDGITGSKSLTASEAVSFEDEGAECKAGGNVINLSQQGNFSKFMDKDCTLKAKATIGLELNKEDKLVGTYLVSFDVSGKCPKETQSCQMTASVEGTRGTYTQRVESASKCPEPKRGVACLYLEPYDHKRR